MKRLLNVCVLFVCGLAGTMPAWGAGAADRELGVQVAMIAGDARMLADPAAAPARREALSARIRSSLGSLNMSARRAAEAEGRANPDLATTIRVLRALLAAGDFAALSRQANQLAAAYPFDASYFEPLAVTPARLETGRSIYRQYCLGCHYSPDPGDGNAAPDLFYMARTVPRKEFFARLLGGIYGDRTTSLENPFTDEELASLAAYFLNGDSAAAAH